MLGPRPRQITSQARFSPAAHHYHTGAAFLEIPGAGQDAATELERAIELYSAAAEPDCSYDHDHMTARVDLAAARLRAHDLDAAQVPGLLDEVTRRGFKVDIAVLDKGYDAEIVYSEIENRHVRPIIPLIKTPAVKAGKDKPPACEHGEWTFAGSDVKRGASKWRCPTGECEPRSKWIKASRLHLLVPRSTDRFREFYCQRGVVEREFGVLKHQWALLPLRVRRLTRVRLHVDLTILAALAAAASATSQESAKTSAATA